MPAKQCYSVHASSCRLTLHADYDFAPLCRDHDAERLVGHAVARDPVGDPPAFIAVEFPGRACVAEELVDVYPPVAAYQRVPDEPGLLLPGADDEPGGRRAAALRGTACGNAGSTPYDVLRRG